jgi:ABC-2 type transport system permease protein
MVEWSLALAAFWTTRVSALNQAYFVGLLFLSGQMAPISLLPPWVQTLTGILPFRWMVSFPVELILGRLTIKEAALGLGVQAVWVIAAVVLARRLWQAGLRVYSAVGG